MELFAHPWSTVHLHARATTCKRMNEKTAPTTRSDYNCTSESARPPMTKCFNEERYTTMTREKIFHFKLFVNCTCILLPSDLAHISDKWRPSLPRHVNALRVAHFSSFRSLETVRKNVPTCPWTTKSNRTITRPNNPRLICLTPTSRLNDDVKTILLTLTRLHLGPLLTPLFHSTLTMLCTALPPIT